MAALAALVGLLGAAAALVYFVSNAFAASPPPFPVIAAPPAKPTTATSASFTYTDSTHGVSFRCSLDSPSFSSCASGGQTYNNLSDGTHNFSVEALVGGGPASTPTSYSWRVDTTPPVISLSFPANNGDYNAASWNAGCSTTGICCTASDPTGVASVSVGIYQSSSHHYWNGSGFSSSSLVLNAATGTTSWHYGLTLPSDGTYTLYVRASDGLGNTTSTSQLLSAGFQIDTSPPPAPSIADGAPPNPSQDTSPEITIADTESNLTAWCALDSGSPVNCTGDTDNDNDPVVLGEWQYNNLAAGPHCFYAYVVDGAGNHSPITKFCWTVIGRPASITVSSGTPQSATVHSSFTAPLVAKVTDSYGSPVPGVTVTFSAPSSGASGTFSNSSTTMQATTNSSGLASSSTFTANTTAGSYTVAATTSGVSGSANFALTNNAGSPSQLAFFTAPVSGPASSSANLGPITVQVEDSYGNVAKVSANTIVKLSSTSTGASFSLSPSGSPITSVTVSSGQSTASFFYGDTKADGPRITASSGSLSSANQTETITAGLAKTIAVFSGSSQAATVNTNFTSPLVAVVTDAYANPVAGFSVSFTAPLSGSSGTFSNSTRTISALTASNGQASSSTYKANTVAGGPYLVSATGSGLNTANFSETNNPGVAVKVVITPTPSTAAASGTTNVKVGLQLVDQYGNATTSSGTTHLVLSTSSSGGFFSTANGGTGTLGGTMTASFTNGVGMATEYYGDENAADPIVTAKNGSTWGTMNLIITAGSPKSIAVYFGSPQTTPVNTSFANPLIALVTDAYNNPVPSISVSFKAPASGASAIFSNSTGSINITTGSNGQASSGSFKANGTAGGPYTVAATTSGVIGSANFSLTNTGGAATAISVSSGAGQSASLGAAFANPLVALVTGAGSVPVPNVIVTFMAPASGSSGTFAGCSGGNPTLYECVVTTNASGLATSSVFTANNTGGVYYTITASAAGVSTPAQFTDMLNGANFTITGPSTGLTPLYPGQSESLNVSIYNPNPESIKVALSSLGGSVSNTSIPACDPTWFKITPTSTSDTVTVAAGATVSLSGSSVLSSDWPVLSMTDLPTTDQGSCEGATLQLSLSGTASGS